MVKPKSPKGNVAKPKVNKKMDNDGNLETAIGGNDDEDRILSNRYQKLASSRRDLLVAQGYATETVGFELLHHWCWRDWL